MTCAARKRFAVLAAMLLTLALPALPGRAQSLQRCNLGEQVTDGEGKTGIIVAAANPDVCQIRYGDGQVRGWAFWSLRPATAAAPRGDAENSIVLRPPSSRTLVFRADASGHFRLTAAANGAPLNFLVDTGATLVFLTPKDARAAGIGAGELNFSQRANTGNGPVKVAPVLLRDIRINDLTVERVPAAVIESIPQSVLGMSFLERLKSFEIRGGALTINW